MNTLVNTMQNDEVCRICMEHSGNKVSLLSTDQVTSLLLKDMVMSLAEVEITENDDLPSTICTNCHKLVSKSYQLKKQCETSDRILRESFQKQTEEKTFIQLNEHSYDAKIESEYKEEDSPLGSPVEGASDSDTNQLETDIHPCPVCQKIYLNEKNLEIHMEKHPKSKTRRKKQSDPRPFKCDKCTKSFSCRTRLEAHGSVHSEEKPYVCGECNKAFKHKFSHKVHMLKHEKKDSFVCDVCNKEFFYKPEFRKHVKLHSGDSYQCHLCGKKSTTAGNLRAHIRVHEGKRSHFCTLCDKGFYDKEHLRRHMRSHTGEKPYVCKFCPKRFSSRDKFRKHTRIHTEEDPYKCTACNKIFAAHSTLKAHEKSHRHNERQQTFVNETQMFQNQVVLDISGLNNMILN